MNINKKIFFGYIIIFIITIFIGYILGRYVFQEIYEYTKKTELQKQVDKLITKPITTESIRALEKKMNVDIIAYNHEREYNIKRKFEYITIEHDKQEYVIILDNLLDDLNEEIPFNLTDEISVTGFKMFEGNYIIPIKLSYKEKDYIDYEFSQEVSGYSKIELVELINADLKEISLKKNSKEHFLEIVLEAYVKENEFLEDKQFTYKESEHESEKNEIIIKKIEDQKIILVYSYKNITDLFGELKIYFLLLIVIGVILIIILTAFFTNMITKPILKITKITNKMSQLDFKEKLNIKNHDEIGNLAENINDLAFALDKTLKQLENDKKNTKDLMGNLSHEFKTPLTIISGYVDLLHETNNQKYLDIVSEEVDRLSLLINETTKAISLDTEIITLNYEKFDLKVLILDIVERFSLNIPASITLILNLDSAIIKADKNKIEQVIYNFVSNAIKYANTFIEIGIRSHFDKIYFYIKNDGEKLTKNEQENIWLKFFKINKYKNNTGRGLGLYISQSILKLHDAKYGVKNTEDGVIFYFSLGMKK